MTYTKEQFELISKYLGEELEDEFLEGISGGRAMNDEEFAHLSKTLQKISSQPGFTKEDDKRLRQAVLYYYWAIARSKEGSPTYLFDFEEWGHLSVNPWRS